MGAFPPHTCPFLFSPNSVHFLDEISQTVVRCVKDTRLRTQPALMTLGGASSLSHQLTGML